MGRMGVLQGDWQGLMSQCFRNLLSSSWIPLRASGFKGYCLFQEYFSPGLKLFFLLGEHGTDVFQTSGSTHSLTPWGMFWGEL